MRADPPKPKRPAEDRTPANILKRPLRLPMERVQGCTCRKPIIFEHADGRVTCVRCRGLVEEVEG